MDSTKISSKVFNFSDGSEYGLQSSLRTGLKTVQNDMKLSHPLEKPCKQFVGPTTLRNSQGIHAPLRLQMEINAANKAITRLPCLPSSNFARDILDGNDDTICDGNMFSIEDFETIGDPHAMMEHRLGLKPL
uniref:Proteasome maturation protein n=1 Tax=Phallusia mammillata TaxID=59560 RepID=A0A6F9DPC5_9ASCI|nr:proteasome maturation protein [Phallusia mammillata]